MTLTLIYIIQYLSTSPSGSIYHITCLVVETGKGLLLSYPLLCGALNLST